MTSGRHSDLQALDRMRAAAPRFLVVEDNPSVALMLTNAITELGGVVVAHAVDTDEALTRAEALRPAAAFIDLNLRDGATGCAIAENLATRFGVVVVLVTGEPQAIPLEFRHALGLVEKPLRPDRLALAMTLIARALTA